MRDRACSGSIAVELGLAIPILFFVLLGGLQFGRALMTRHRLESAVGFAARSSVVSGQKGQAAIAAMVRQQLGTELDQCAPLRVSSRVLPGVAGTPDAIEVSATCTMVKMFQAIPGVEDLRAVAAMPLPFSVN